MTIREKIQLSALSGTKLELNHDEVKRVYDLVGWAANHLFGLPPEIAPQHPGVQALAALSESKETGTGGRCGNCGTSPLYVGGIPVDHVCSK
jgi:hypothetical protein